MVRFPSHTLQPLGDIWQRTDESVFDIQSRRRFDQNGLRAGILIGELPKMIRDQIQETSTKQTTDALEHAGLAADVDSRMRQLQCRAGRRKELIVRRELSKPLTIVTTFDGKLSGATYEKAAVLFDLRAIPHGDGQATIELTPEVQHGVHRQAFVSTAFGVRQEMQRPRETWKQLAIQAKLSPGQVLVVSSTLPPKAIGSAFFTTQTVHQTEEHVVLLVRLAETRWDDLFGAEAIKQAKAMAER